MEKFLNDLLALVNSGTSFIAGQMPDYVNQLLVGNYMVNMFYIWSLSGGVLLATVLFFVFLEYTVDEGEESIKMFATVFLGVFLLSLIMLWFIYVPEAIKDNIMIEKAPKVYVVDYLREVIGGKR